MDLKSGKWSSNFFTSGSGSKYKKIQLTSIKVNWIADLDWIGALYESDYND